jgi:hypothetical protein
MNGSNSSSPSLEKFIAEHPVSRLVNNVTLEEFKIILANPQETLDGACEAISVL